MASTEDFPEILSNHVTSLRDALPPMQSVPSLAEVFSSQERLSTNMARHLESLASHYDQMAAALRDKEAGVLFSEDDLTGEIIQHSNMVLPRLTHGQDMNRDTDELPSIIAELEDDIAAVESS